jgi:ketosteroid isomerase-like protein
MSEENVALVRWGLEAWTREGAGSLAPFVGDDLVVRRLDPMPDPGTWRGRDALTAATDDWLGAFSDFTMTPAEFIDAGDRVVVRLDQEGRGVAGDVPVSGTAWFVFGLLDGRLVTVDMYGAREDALRGAGLK